MDIIKKESTLRYALRIWGYVAGGGAALVGLLWLLGTVFGADAALAIFFFGVITALVAVIICSVTR